MLIFVRSQNLKAMKHWILFTFCLVFLSCNSTKKAERIYGPDLFTHWIHLFEEDGADYRAFRRSDYAFPPARGREGFEIKSDGSFVHYQIGPVDAPVVVNGKWKMQGNNRLHIMPETGEAWTLEIVELSKDLLKAK